MGHREIKMSATFIFYSAALTFPDPSPYPLPLCFIMMAYIRFSGQRVRGLVQKVNKRDSPNFLVLSLQFSFVIFIFFLHVMQFTWVDHMEAVLFVSNCLTAWTTSNVTFWTNWKHCIVNFICIIQELNKKIHFQLSEIDSNHVRS